MAFGNSIQFKIDSDQIDATLSNFPLRLYLTGATGPDNIDFSDVFTELGDSDRKKISVMDGATECYVEIVYWDATSEKAVLDIRAPNVSSSVDTILTLYYDAAETENTTYVGDTGSTPAQTVWDSNYSTVIHFTKSPASALTDATGNSHSATPHNLAAGDLVTVSPAIKAVELDGADSEYFTLPAAASVKSQSAVTVEGFFRPDSFTPTGGTHNFLFYESTAFSGYGRLALRYLSTQKIGGYARDSDNDAAFVVAGTTTLSAASWYHGAIRYDAGANSLEVLLDGVSEAENTDAKGSFSISTPDDDIGVGAYLNPSFTSYPNLTYAEFRLSLNARSDAWLKATAIGLKDNLVKSSGAVATTDDMATATTLAANATDDLPTFITLHGLGLDDLATDLALASWQRDDLATRSDLSYMDLDDLSTALMLTDGTALASLATRIGLTDGVVTASLATRTALVRKAPAFTAVIAQRLRSVKHA